MSLEWNNYEKTQRQKIKQAQVNHTQVKSKTKPTILAVCIDIYPKCSMLYSVFEPKGNLLYTRNTRMSKHFF